MKIKQITKNLIDYIITATILFLVLLVKPLSINLRTKVGKLFGNIIYKLSKKRRLITLENLRNAFPDKDEIWINQICRKTYQNLGIVFTEIFWLRKASDAEILSLVEFKDKLLFQEVISRGRGLILLSAHFGNWELMALAGGLYFDVPFTIIVKPQSNKFLDKYLNEIRTSRNNKIIDMYHSAYDIIKLIKKKGNLALLADQSATSDKDIYVDFFGRKVATFDAPAQLALKFQMPIIMCFAIRQNDGTYFVDYFELDYSDLTDSPNGVAELTQRHAKILEDMIRKYPDHWVWLHRRWKHTLN